MALGLLVQLGSALAVMPTEANAMNPGGLEYWSAWSGEVEYPNCLTSTMRTGQGTSAGQKEYDESNN